MKPQDPVKAKIEAVKEKLGKEAEGKHFFIGSKRVAEEEPERYASYTPVKIDDEQVKIGTHPLFMRDEEATA